MRENYIKGSDNVCGVIGDPIAHTLSPLIHNTLSEKLGQRAVYVPFCVTKENLKTAVSGAHALGIKGLNVTMPHKQEMFKYVIEVSKEANTVGAINTLVYTNEGYIGHNTDAEGLALSLKEKGIEWTGKKVVIIGSGGAAYAAYTAVADTCESICIVNRTKEKAEALKTHMTNYYNIPTFVYEDAEDLELEAYMVIQTTGLGMGGLKGQMPKCSEKLLKTAEVAVDLIYEPWETKFLETARKEGCITVNGFGMLYYQAVIAYELMHHMSCDKEAVLQIKQELLKDREQ
ncbi:shikimate dehydrogenase [Cellulosilyticum ruminicola]|uniref:shikimate dehydrogenase n=1 Tax=Cellulosilyticum ruminicola TaxID=425254 RepID=UPI0006D1D67C|nr:shikimate dehydrogenase [Cellulosilyticum ruminicola]